jgi:cellulose synthase/poly-beta-1,6-N-acetylglucosamine synthase-like glycosyltransferase
VTLIPTIVLAGSLATWIWLAVRLARLSGFPALAPGGTTGDPPSGWPSLSVVVACRNEEAAVEETLASLAAQDYPGLEIIAVDDRSTDRTGARLAALAERTPSMRVIRVEALPAGWLGKNHALDRGQEAATGDLLLFTDADVVFSPGVLRHAVAWLIGQELGHGVVLPRMVAPHFLERSFVAAFSLFFLAGLRLEDLRKAGTRAHVGVGAFNLVSAAEYRRVGGHRRLRLEVVDDMKLGLVLRRSGVRQGVIDSAGLVRVRWQQGLLATMKGLLKNFFAASEYRWDRTLLGVFAITIATVVPAVALLAGIARPFALAALVLGATLHALVARRISGGTGLEGLTVPLAGFALALVGLTSAILTTARRGIVWRDTRYDLRELRAACIREADWPPGGSPGAAAEITGRHGVAAGGR